MSYNAIYGRIIIAEDKNSGKLKVISETNTFLAGTEITIVPDYNVDFSADLKDNLLVIKAKKDGNDIEDNDIDFEYSIDENDFEEYNGAIELAEGNHTNLKVKYFGQEYELSGEYNSKITVRAIRKNNKVYLIKSGSSNQIKYSFDENGTFTEYKNGIENTDSSRMWIQNGIENAQCIDILDINEMHDVETDTTNVLYRINGSIELDKLPAVANYYTRYYSFNGSDYTILAKYEKKIENSDANEIYIKDARDDYNYSITRYTISNVNDAQYGKIVGSYSKNNNCYIFSQDRRFSAKKVIDGEQNVTRYDVISDYNDIKPSNKNIKAMTTANLKNSSSTKTEKAGTEIFVLSDDGNVYKMNKNGEYEQIAEDSDWNIVLISDIYAVGIEANGNQKILKYDYNEKKYKEGNNYNIEKRDTNSSEQKNIIKLASNSRGPLVLYDDGTFKSLVAPQPWESEIKYDNVIDVASNGNDIFILKFGEVILTSSSTKIDITSYLAENEYPIQINKNGDFLTSAGKLYNNIGNSDDEQTSKKFTVNGMKYNLTAPERQDVSGLGDYTFMDKNGNAYYRKNARVSNYDKLGEENHVKFYKNKVITEKVYNYVENNSEITKDETKLNENKVIINVRPANNISNVIDPNGESHQGNFDFTVTENGEYVFKFKDTANNDTIKVVHVNTIQSRKETKVPTVTALNGYIKLESDENIDVEYSLDSNAWNDYASEIKYENSPIYARIKNNQYECSILKITLNEDGNLEVNNMEERKLQGEIVVNGIGVDKDQKLERSINYDEDNTKNSEGSNNNNNILTWLNNAINNIIYTFSSTDGKYAGCYFEDNKTEIMFKDMNNDIRSINNHNSKGEKEAVEDIIEYGIVDKDVQTTSIGTFTEQQEKDKENNGEILSYKRERDGTTSYWVETLLGDYVYVNSEGEIKTNKEELAELINKIKENNNNNLRFTKIVGDSYSYYILTEKGEVYFVTLADNGNWTYVLDKIGTDTTWEYFGRTNSNSFIVKLNVRNIVNIYDDGTAKTVDGKYISLIKDDEESTSVVQEIEKNTDKYLVESHLILKDGILYKLNKENNYEVQLVNAGKIQRTNKDNSVGKISKVTDENSEASTSINKIIMYLDDNNKQDDADNITAIEDTNIKLPKFVDIAEARDSNLISMLKNIYRNHTTLISSTNFETADKYIICYAIAENGEIWAYINGYIVDTGINLDYFGPTSNYKLDNINWTNKNITLTPSGNSNGKIAKIVMKKGNDTIYDGLSNEDASQLSNNIEKNGEYIVEVTDTKGRTYSNKLGVVNIDKLKPSIEELNVEASIANGEISINISDADATNDNAKSGIATVQYTFEEQPNDNTNWTNLEAETDEEGNTIIHVPNVDDSEQDEKIIYTKEQNDNGNIVLKLKNSVESVGEKRLFARAVDNAGNISDPIEIVIPADETGKVIVKYMDLEGNKLANDIILTKKVDEDYQTEKINIDGYEFVDVEGNEQGKVKKEVQTVIYKYKKIEIPEPEIGKVIVKYEDLDGNKLAEEKTLTGEVDKDYTTEQLNIEGYEFKEIIGNKEGKFAKEDQEVVYKYKKIETPAPEPEPVVEEGKVIVKYEDVDGNKLAEENILTGKVGENYKTERKEIEKYKFVKVEGAEEGKFVKGEIEVIYKYEKLSGKVIVKYVDKDGNSLKDNDVIVGKIDEKYEVSRVKISGYNLVNVAGYEKGKFVQEDQVVVYTYEKVINIEIPQTGQTRIIYILIGTILVISIISIGYIEIKRRGNNKVNK